MVTSSSAVVVVRPRKPGNVVSRKKGLSVDGVVCVMPTERSNRPIAPDRTDLRKQRGRSTRRHCSSIIAVIRPASAAE